MRGLDLQKLNESPTPTYIYLSGIPLPPTSNKQYSSFVRNGKIIRVSSHTAASYKREFHAWAMLNRQSLHKSSLTLAAWNSSLDIKAFIIFEKSKLVSKDGHLKKLDTTNRLKALHDLISAALNIDDSHFISSYCEKIISNSSDQSVSILITPRKINHEAILNTQLIQEGIII